MQIPIERYDTVNSVMDEASRLKDEGIMVPPFAVTAKEMTAAQGRFNKKWHATCNNNLHLSMSFPSISIKGLKLSSIWFSIEILKALQNLFPLLNFKIKWPNDIYCNNKKISGMVSKASNPDDENNGSFILGLGLNVNTNLDTIPFNYQSLATSLKIESGKESNMNNITEQVVKSLYNGYLNAKAYKNIVDEFNSVDYLKDKKILYPIEGIGYGIDKDGIYYIETDKEKHPIILDDIILKDEKGLKEIVKGVGCNFFCNYEL